MKPLVTMRQALADPDLFGSILAGELWAAWRVLLIAIVGEELKPEERIVFEMLTGRPHEAQEAAEEAWLIKGRRGAGHAPSPSWRPTAGAFATMRRSWRPASGRRSRSCPRRPGRLRRCCNTSMASFRPSRRCGLSSQGKRTI